MGGMGGVLLLPSPRAPRAVVAQKPYHTSAAGLHSKMLLVNGLKCSQGKSANFSRNLGICVGSRGPPWAQRWMDRLLSCGDATTHLNTGTMSHWILSGRFRGGGRGGRRRTSLRCSSPPRTILQIRRGSHTRLCDESGGNAHPLKIALE